MVSAWSETGGTFVSDNIISNEIAFQQVIPELQQRRQEAYLGVGPEQNFTYITAFRPAIAFIVDLQRENLLLHLLYKALVELSTGRADFMSRLFSRPEPAGVGPGATARALFDAFDKVSLSEQSARKNLQAVLDHLRRGHGFPLSDADERGIAKAYRSLYMAGPHVRGDFGGGSWIPSYSDLMAQTDLHGEDHSYLASEANFLSLKEYETKNLVVPLVGDFGGDKTIRDVSSYLRAHDLTVTIFYTSNVEEYLFKNGCWNKFVQNVSTLPIDEDSMFIRAYFTHTQVGLRTLVAPIRALLDASASGEIHTYDDVIQRSRAPIQER